MTQNQSSLTEISLYVDETYFDCKTGIIQAAVTIPTSCVSTIEEKLKEYLKNEKTLDNKPFDKEFKGKDINKNNKDRANALKIVI